jgi:hypothetical protein
MRTERRKVATGLERLHYPLEAGGVCSYPIVKDASILARSQYVTAKMAAATVYSSSCIFKFHEENWSRELVSSLLSSTCTSTTLT